MPDQYSIAEARDRFAQIIHDAENGKSIEIMRRGKPVAVVLSLSQYQSLTEERKEFGAGLGDFRKKHQIHKLDIDPDEVFNDVRDRSSGREVSF